MKEEGDGGRDAGATKRKTAWRCGGLGGGGKGVRKRGSQFGILNLANVVLGDLPPHLRICK